MRRSGQQRLVATKFYLVNTKKPRPVRGFFCPFLQEEYPSFPSITGVRYAPFFRVVIPKFAVRRDEEEVRYKNRGHSELVSESTSWVVIVIPESHSRESVVNAVAVFSVILSKTTHLH